ncbi:MAG: NYN domain-containing protein [Cellulosilyticaceae bacterium]
MKKLVIGILAHVDAGKTTLSESMLYLAGKIRKLGRVDNQDAYLDTYELEKARGITIFSKQAMFEFGDVQITLMDTPGHVDFSAEMERTLQVLDYAILVINGTDGVQGHTRTLWHLLKRYKIPVFLFVNKMDQQGTDAQKRLAELKNGLDERCIAFEPDESDSLYDQLAMCDEQLLETYLEAGKIETPTIANAIKTRKVFPCFFGSALKLEGVTAFMDGLIKYTLMPSYPDIFGAKIFKIARDNQGNRLTYMKLTGGSLKVKDTLTHSQWEDKVNQIRLYSGEKFETVTHLSAGSICAVTGLNQTRPGEGIGSEKASEAPLLEPVLSYQIVLPEGYDARMMLPKLRQLEEEDPALHIVWNEQLQEIQAQIMGEVQIEILQSLITSRFGVSTTFDSGKIVYKETISNKVEGVGHFEPLRHYAEVHLLLEPGEPGSGIQFASNCSEDLLEKNWQRLILSHLEEKNHRGVLTGAFITDMKITLVSGRAHKKHTVGGDFREATYRAVRQGLKQAESILFEPYYAFQLELPEKMVGRAMTDIEKMHGSCELVQTDSEMAILVGSAPVVTMRNYQQEVTAYTKGHGRLFCSLKGYEPCHNTEEVLSLMNYDSERDLDNPTGSVFCAHGAGFSVPWDKVHDYMHLENYLLQDNGLHSNDTLSYETPAEEDTVIGLDEIDQIINRTFYANQGEKSVWKKKKTAHQSYYDPTSYISRPKEKKQEYLLIDGYNIIFAWPELKVLAEENMDGAKIKLLECLSNYQGIRKCEIIVVFDAYRVQGHRTETIDYLNIHMVYTKEAQTADHYIEKFVHEHHAHYQVTVATSDGLEQIIIRGKGAALLSARELKQEMERAHYTMMENYQALQPRERNYLEDALSPEVRAQLEQLSMEES